MDATGRLSGKVALVTGAAAGIGKSICARFVTEGAKVVYADIDFQAATAAIEHGATNALAVECDVADPAAAKRAIELTIARFGGLHVLVNNAAVYAPHASVESMSLEEWNRALAVNLTGAMLMSKYAIPALRQQGGSIIHIASQLGHVGREGRACYSMTKAALMHLATAMAIDHAGDRIRVNSLSPGPVSTERVVRNYGGPEPHAARVGPMTLIGRAGRADEIAQAAVFLASDESSFVTGVDLLVDGGYTAR